MFIPFLGVTARETVDAQVGFVATSGFIHAMFFLSLPFPLPFQTSHVRTRVLTASTCQFFLRVGCCLNTTPRPIKHPRGGVEFPCNDQAHPLLGSSRKLVNRNKELQMSDVDQEGKSRGNRIVANGR